MRGWCATALPVAAVLAVDPGGLSPFGPAKWLVVPVLVLAGLAAAWWHGRGGPGRAWLVLLGIAVLSALLAVDPLHAWIGTHERRFGALTWVLCAGAFVVGRSLDRAERRRVAAACSVAVGLVGLWVLAELLGWEPIDLVGAGDRPVGTFGSSAYLGAAAALLAPVAVGVAMVRSRPGWWVAAGLGVLALVASGARAAWLGALVAAIAAAVANRRAPWRPVLAALGFGLALALVTGVAGRVPDAVTDRDGGLRGRIDEWRIAARVVADEPVLGVGPEGYRIAFGGHVDDAYERAHGRTPLPDRAHSAPLDVAATLGLVGLVAWGALLLTAGRPVPRALRADPMTAGIAAGLVAYAVQSLFLFPLAELDPVAWLLAGTLAARAVTRPVRPLAIAAAGLAAAALVVGMLGVVADRRVLDDPSAAIDLRPDVLTYHLAAARAAERGGDLPAALGDVRHALDLSPDDPVARSEEARLLLELEPGEALVVLEDLAGDDPRNAEVLLRLGVARARTGDLEGAIAVWRRVEDLAPGSTAAAQNIARAEAELRDGT